MIEVTELAGYADAMVQDVSVKLLGFRQVPQLRVVGSNFPLVRQVAELAPKVENGRAIPRKPTHVAIQQIAILAAPKDTSTLVATIEAGTTVAIMETSGGWLTVARDGQHLGYAKVGGLAPLQ
jgi:hypothetical protein